MPLFTYDIPIRFSEIDLYRIAWHGHYVAWLEEARNRLAKEASFSLADFFDRGYVFPVIELEVKYKRPLRLGDTVRIAPRYVPEAIARITFEYDLATPEGTVIASARTRQVVLRNEELLLTFPADVKAVFERLVEIQQEP